MFPLLPIAVAGGVVGAVLLRPRKEARLLVKLTNQPQAGIIEQVKNELQEVGKTVTQNLTASLVAADERYQTFVQNHIDPLLGKTRHAQMQELLSEAALTLSPEERMANQRLALGVVTLGTAVVGQLAYAPLLPVAGVLGLASMWTTYYYAYLQWQQTRRLGSLHLLCIYLAVLWLGGYATIGAVGALLMGVGLKVKAITENQSRNHLINIFHLQPATVWVRSAGVEVEIPFAQLQVGDTLVVSAGQVVPVDGTIIAGVGTIDQHMLTGEAQPVEKTLGDPVLASTVVLSGKLDVRVEKTGAETTAGQIGVILNQTAQMNTEMGLRVLQLTDRFALPTLALSAVSFPLIGAAGAVSLLGANTTITTYMSGTLAVLNFLNIAAENGILVKVGGALERVTDIDTIVFDKTGTLTLEQPQLAQVHTLNGVSEATLLMLAAAAEARQTHPIARAILAAAEAQQLPLPPIAQAHYEVGYGIKVWLNPSPAVRSQSAVGSGQWAVASHQSSGYDLVSHEAERKTLVRVGSARFMNMEGVALPERVAELTKACQAQGHSLVMVAMDDQLVGCIEFRPTVRPEARRIIDGLRGRGLALYIISGDQEAPTRKLAQDLGMTGYFANTLPEGKADLVEGLQGEGRRVCFIGDGINDSIAMRKAQVSISLRGATSAATDTAQIILMEGNLSQLLHLFALAEEFERNLKQNLRFTSALSLTAVGGILFAGFSFVATEVLYTASLIGGLGIAMKPLLDEQKRKQA
jgi:heavy metal translocating P-type ATPase